MERSNDVCEERKKGQLQFTAEDKGLNCEKQAVPYHQWGKKQRALFC